MTKAIDPPDIARVTGRARCSPCAVSSGTVLERRSRHAPKGPVNHPMASSGDEGGSHRLFIRRRKRGGVAEGIGEQVAIQLVEIVRVGRALGSDCEAANAGEQLASLGCVEFDTDFAEGASHVGRAGVLASGLNRFRQCRRMASQLA